MLTNNFLRRLRGNAPLVKIELPGLPPFRMETHGRRDIYISRSIDAWGHWEGSTTAVLLQLLHGSADFIDVGANIGWFTLTAAQALAGRGEVHSFEPDPANFAKLRANVAINKFGNVSLKEVALSRSSETATLFLNASNLGDHSLHAAPHRPGAVVVRTERLDDYAGLGMKRPLIIKLDVQGSERDVLAGAHRILTGYPHELVLLSELSLSMLGDAGLEEMIANLAGLGFAAALIDRDHPRILPMPWHRLVELHRAGCEKFPEADCDFLAFRRPDGMMKPFFSGNPG